MCVSVTPTSVVDLNFNPPSWLGWMKLLAAIMNWSLSPITFLTSLPIVLSRTIGLKDLGVSYDFLFSLGMMTVVDLLKCEGQYPNISYADNAIQAFIIFEDDLEMTPQQLIWTRGWSVVAVCYGNLEFFLWKWRPRGSWFIDDFIKSINVHLTMESCVESGMKCVSQVVNVVTLLTIMFDGSNSR